MRNALFFILGVAPAYHRNLETREQVHQMYSIVIPIQWQSYSLVYKMIGDENAEMGNENGCGRSLGNWQFSRRIGAGQGA